MAMDGFAMFEEEEEKERVNDTVLKGMDVDSICADIDEQNNKKYHLDKLFHPQGPYFTQTQQFEHEQKMKSKRKQRRRSVHNQGNFMDKISPDIYKDEYEDEKDYCLVSLFEDPKEKEVRISELIKNKRKKT